MYLQVVLNSTKDKTQFYEEDYNTAGAKALIMVGKAHRSETSPPKGA